MSPNKQQPVRTPAGRKEPALEAPDDGATGNIDKIRDIIFGSQMQEYDRRFRVLEDRLLKASADLRADLDKRVTSLESFLRKELDSITTSLKGERDARTTALEGTLGKLSDLRQHAEQRLAELADQASAQDRDMRAALKEQSQSLRDDLHERVTALSTELQNEAEDLRRGKTDRADLAAILTEMALRLTPEADDKKGRARR